MGDKNTVDLGEHCRYSSKDDESLNEGCGSRNVKKGY